ncbi:autotransporter family protein [Fusobacterium varium]
MIEKIMKAVKKGNKKRSKNITIGAVIGFLLSCTAVMGADSYLWIKGDGGEIEFNTTETVDGGGSWNEGNWDTENPYENVGNIWEENTYTNNTTLSSSAVNGKYWNYDISYGLRLSGDLTDVNFINNGSITGEISGSGISYGIHNSATMGNIENTGTISGSGTGTGNSNGTGYGIENIDGTIRDIKNTGVISGAGISSSGSGQDNSYGCGIGNSGEMGAITNTGVISGSGTSSSGYRIYNRGTIGDITNTGVIYGKTNAIKNESFETIDTAKNYGILATKGSSEVDGLTMGNFGMYITGDEGVVTSVTGGSQTVKFGTSEREMIIKNADIEGGSGTGTSTESIELGNNNYDNYILNGKDETLKVTDTNNQVTGSIINAYGTAVVFGDTGNKELTLSGTIVNGGIDEDDSNPGTKVAAILGSDDTDNGDTLILQSGKIKYKDGSEVTQNTVVNGNINMGAGADTLTIGDGTIINGILDGGDSDSEDTLNFGISSGAKSNSSESEGVRILHNISNFENMNINTNVTLFEKTINASGEVENLKVTGAEKITIEENGTLTLRIDSTNKDNLSGKIIGHALYENEGEISSTDGGKLLLALNGAGNKEIISFGGTKLNTSLVTEYEGVYYEDVTFGTTSLIHSVKRVNGTENEVEITVKKNLPLKALKYEKLNKIYHGILSVEDLIANFNVDDESLSIFLGYLNDIYAGNPYSYSSELSRKSVGMFRDIAVEGQFKPELNKWLIMGGLTHVDGGTKDTYYGKGYYTYDIGSSDMDADTKITGAYMLGEYGVSDTLAYGVVIGGNKLKSELSNGSKVDGDALYMGVYAKKYIGNLKVTGGLGLQYGDYDADRFAAGKGITETRSYSDNYNDMTYDIYLNGRYSYNIGNNLFLEPYGTLSYTYIKQDNADEGSKVLAIETDSKSFDYTAAKVGVDLKKVIPHEKGKSTLSAGVSYTRLLNGADEENITARFKGKDASDFDILVAHKNENSIGLNAKYALELESGILFDVKGSYSVERDSHNGNGKNRTKGEWIVGTGLGYKF